MSVIITLKDIEETIENLNYRSETTLKSKLIRAIRKFYNDESSAAALNSIDTEQLVKLVWDTGEDATLIKNKRKNFSSLKSSINSDLKKLCSEGKNHQGIIISHDNIFDISDEAKNKALAAVAEVFREKGVDSPSKINEILNALSDISADTISSANAAEAREEIERLKNIIGSLSAKVELPMLEGKYQGKTSGPEDRGPKSDGGIGIKTPAEETPSGKGGEEAISAETQRNTFADITAVLQDQEIDFPDKISKIKEAIQSVLTDAISCAGPELNNEDAQQIRNLFGNLSNTLQTALDQESGIGAGDNLTGFAGSLPEQSPESRKLSNIKETVNELLANALADCTAGLTNEETEQIKNLFGLLANEVKSALTKGRGLDAIGTAAGWGDKDSIGAVDVEGDVVEDIAQAGTEEIVEVIDELDSAQLPIEDAVTVEEPLLSYSEEFAPEDDLEEMSIDQYEEAEVVAEELPDGKMDEVVEEIMGDSLMEEGTDDETIPGVPEVEITPADYTIEDNELTGQSLAPEEQIEQNNDAMQDLVDYEEIIAADDSGALPLAALPEETVVDEEDITEETAPADVIIETGETLPDDYELAELAAENKSAGLADEEIVEEAASSETEGIIEELLGDEEERSAHDNTPAGKTIDADFLSTTEILTQMAEAAKALEKIGPDLSNSIYSEEEIKEKAKFLSEEFDRYLSVREKFYNQHILIKGGNYPVGGARNEFPEQIANLREFYIGKFPVTNALFEIFVEKTGYITTAEKYGFGVVYIPRMQKKKNALTGTESFIWNSKLQHEKIPGACWYRPNGPGSTLYVKRTHPVVQVSLEDACAFAAWTGKRIPTEKEWEAAARTSHGYLYPWGNIWQEDACNLEKSLSGDTSPVDKYLKYTNEYEVADILGNVLEWTLEPWQITPQEEESEETYIIKGASWISDSPACLTDRQPGYKATSSNILGFRCIAI